MHQKKNHKYHAKKTVPTPVRCAAKLLKDAGHSFGTIHTLTSESLDEVEALAIIASAWGADLLQLHPFEAVGRGSWATQMTPLEEHGRLVAYLLVAALSAMHPQLRIQLDLAHRDIARHAPEALQASRTSEPAVPRELVVIEDGSVLPLTYGLDQSWIVTNLKRQPLADAWSGFVGNTWPPLHKRVRAAAVAVARGRFGDVAPWHSIVRRFAADQRPVLIDRRSGSLVRGSILHEPTGMPGLVHARG